MEHATLAHDLRARAAEARAQARRHRALAAAPADGLRGGRASVIARHRRLADRLESLAMDYEEMAQMHEAEAAQG
jgi:hypothetical protein